MIPRSYDTAVREIVKALQDAIDRADTVWIERAMIAIYKLPPSDAVLSHVLRSNEVWGQGQLYQLLEAPPRSRAAHSRVR